MNSIFIICNYHGDEVDRNLNAYLSAMTYVDYIKDVIKSLNYKVNIVSVSSGNSKSYYAWETKVIDSHESHHYLVAFKKASSSVISSMNLIFNILQMTLWIVKYTSRKDRILVYHNKSWSHFYTLIEFFSRRKLDIIVAEVFGAVYNRGNKQILKELMRIGNQRNYIFINDILPQIIKPIKNYCVCYGNYKFKNGNRGQSAYGDGKIHLVYAGKIDSHDVTDAFLATEVALYLDCRYFVHVLGYGNDNDILKIKRRIEEINSEKRFEIIKYEGCLSGVEYDNFLLKCQIGLCTRTLSQDMSDYCFPSKTLVYLAHNLIPVCPALRSFRESKIAEGLVLVEGDFTPQAIANSIEAISPDMLSRDYTSLLEQIDKDFKNSMMNLLEE